MSDEQQQSDAPAGATTEEAGGSLLDQLLAEAKVSPGEETYDVAKQ
ncbi:MAG: hypothetical protein JKY37_04600, partial [Nannocystaceae bacterium]|nr:hypothetical protein [Nannocystaceae bacterium]